MKRTFYYRVAKKTWTTVRIGLNWHQVSFVRGPLRGRNVYVYKTKGTDPQTLSNLAYQKMMGKI